MRIICQLLFHPFLLWILKSTSHDFPADAVNFAFLVRIHRSQITSTAVLSIEVKQIEQGSYSCFYKWKCSLTKLKRDLLAHALSCWSVYLRASLLFWISLKYYAFILYFGHTIINCIKLRSKVWIVRYKVSDCTRRLRYQREKGSHLSFAISF